MSDAIELRTRGPVDDRELSELHARAFGTVATATQPWSRRLSEHSLTWVTAVAGDRLVGFVNAGWDGGAHAFLLDTVVDPDHRRRGLGRRLVEMLVAEVTAAGCEWLHVDYEPHLRTFYRDACGFRATEAGLLRLSAESTHIPPSATAPSELWPPFGLVLTTGDLTLTPVTDDDLPGLVDLVRSGVHPADEMPFGVPWTRRPAEQVAPEYARHYWRLRAGFTPADFHLDLAVRHRGELVGIQGFSAKDYAVTRTAETGSWLVRHRQGQGLGTRMRRAVCTFLFDHLDAAEVTSGAWVDNPASVRVSEKVGYRATDTDRVARDAEMVPHTRFRLGPDDLVRGDPLAVSGVGALRTFLGLDPLARE